MHCYEIVDLPRYYQDYGTAIQRLDFFTRVAYRRLLKRFREAGLKRTHRFLDYGCGSGNLVTYLRQRGYPHAVGYDPYGAADGSGNRGVLRGESFDFICLQDVIEHVEEPRPLFGELAGLLRPGGVLYVGTPSADDIDLVDAHKHLHQLHQPYHLHLYTRDALVRIGQEAGLAATQFHARFYAETPVFAMNEAFWRRYLEGLGDDIEALVEPPRIGMVLASPALLFHGTFGFLYSPRHSIAVAYQKAADASLR